MEQLDFLGITEEKGPAPPAHGGRRDVFVPTENQRRMVTILAAHGAQKNVIAKILNIDHRTLLKYFKVELDAAFDELKARIMGSVAQRALSGDMNAAKYWLSRWCPEWRLPKDEEPTVDPAIALDDGEVVHFYMPSNGRDEPADDEGPIIEGQAA